MLCSLCEDKQEESEEHLLVCKPIKNQVRNECDLSEARYMDIFSGNIGEQLKITKIFQKVLNANKTLMNMKWTQQHEY